LANPIMNKPQHAHIYVTSLRAAANMVRFGFFLPAWILAILSN
jgi:hypothetical protein